MHGVMLACLGKRSIREFRGSPLAACGQSPSLAFGHSKSGAFHGSCALGTSSMRCSRLFVHSLLATPKPDQRRIKRGTACFPDESGGSVVGWSAHDDAT
jgi:hypothetical protein